MAPERKKPLAPGTVIGIMGGGQLGRMAAQAAAQLGYPCHIYCPEPESPAAQVTRLATVAAYDDREALARFAEAVDVVTYEFENIPLETVEFLAERVEVRPSPAVLAICRNRLQEKDFCRKHSVPTTRYAEVSGLDALTRTLRDIGRPAVLKTTELGYDGKGQIMLENDADLAAAWEKLSAGNPQAVCILEAFVELKLEISVIVARALDGTIQTYEAAENQHKNHILDQTIVPARVAPNVAYRAEVIARHLAEELDLVGLLAVEMFVTDEGQILVNELAPRPHNSGHWTIDGAITSQFEQFIRAVAGLPLGSVVRHSDAVMKNLLGDEIEGWQEIVSDPAAKLHLYGKTEPRPGRKMGHVTRLGPKKSGN